MLYSIHLLTVLTSFTHLKERWSLTVARVHTCGDGDGPKHGGGSKGCRQGQILQAM